jgi:hypothetical protein
MATPYMAGASALLLQARGKIIARQTRSIFQTTATPISSSAEPNALPETLAQQGAGMINVFAAIKSTTSVTPAELLLNDTASWRKEYV